MGQKVNPVGMRVGVNRNWTSRWYANDQQFHVFLNEDIKIREYLIKELKDAMLSHVEIERQKTDGNLRVDVVEVKQPDLDATLVAQSIAKQLEERASFRTAQKKAIQRVRKAGAKGCRTLVSGRLGGAEIARSEGYKEGIIPLHTLRSDIDYAVAEAATTYGRIGVKVWICRGEIRPSVKSQDKGGDK